MFRLLLAILLSGISSIPAIADPQAPGSSTAKPATTENAFAEALLQSVGGPAKADLLDQATLRLVDGQILIPRDAAARYLTSLGLPVPANFAAVLIASSVMDAQSLIRFVPSGFVDADAALGWNADDFLSSLKDTIETANAVRITQHLPEKEVRRWAIPPLYDPETHQLSWASLTQLKSAPRDTDGEIVYHAIGFGRDGYIELSITTSLQNAEETARIGQDFLHGLSFIPGKAYHDASPQDPRAPGGLAAVMEIASLHKATAGTSPLASDTIVPVIGTIVAAIGGLSLLLYIQRHLRRQSRRI